MKFTIATTSDADTWKANGFPLESLCAGETDEPGLVLVFAGCAHRSDGLGELIAGEPVAGDRVAALTSMALCEGASR